MFYRNAALLLGLIVFSVIPLGGYSTGIGADMDHMVDTTWVAGGIGVLGGCMVLAILVTNWEGRYWRLLARLSLWALGLAMLGTFAWGVVMASVASTTPTPEPLWKYILAANLTGLTAVILVPLALSLSWCLIALPQWARGILGWLLPRVLAFDEFSPLGSSVYRVLPPWLPFQAVVPLFILILTIAMTWLAIGRFGEERSFQKPVSEHESEGNPTE